jgi:acetyl-CoA C-acetyltransferase
MDKTVILGTARTPVGKLGGGLSSLKATELGGIAIEAALRRAVVEPEQVQHVVMGQVLQAGVGQIPSRQAQINAGIPKEVSSETINKVCASGVRATGILDAAIRAGDVDVAVAGGMESMSQAPYLLPQARFGARMGDMKALDAMVHDGLTNPFTGKQMFVEATEVGEELEMTRADMDRWALRSHERTIAATDDGRLPEEIVAVTVKGRKGDTVVEVDEAPRRETSLESLAKLPGLAHKEGSHTAGNSPGVNDGAGALVLASEDWAVPRPHAGQRGDQGARQGRPAARRHRSVGDQRGVRLGHAQLDPHAQHRRGARERLRRRGRDRASDRRVGRPHPRHAGA